MTSVRISCWRLVCLCTVVIGLLGVATNLQAEVTRVQTLELQAGWNAVYLEVDPLDPTPTAVFAGLPVETVATYWPRITPVESVSNPSDASWKQEGWGVWYAPHRLDAAISTLHAISGHRAYLIRASRFATWHLTGRVEYRRIRWQADSFNLLGFSVDPDQPPTFANYFEPSTAHGGLRCLRLVNGVWTLIRNPDATPIRSGEAYWVYCRGASDYQGTLDVRIQGAGGLNFGPMTEGLGVCLASRKSSATTLRVFGDVQDPRPVLPLAWMLRGGPSMAASWSPISAPVQIPATSPRDSVDVLLRVDWSALAVASDRALLCISEPAGSQVWVPVHAETHEP
ncbi:MAG: hypothetical protein U1G08_12120 [Verrucomicrobiota bacterium]